MASSYELVEAIALATISSEQFLTLLVMPYLIYAPCLLG
jgi:hypothetical protein